MGFIGFKTQHYPIVGLAVLLLLAQLTCTFGLSKREAQTLITFNGDGGEMILATVLMDMLMGCRNNPSRRNSEYQFAIENLNKPSFPLPGH